MIKLNLPLHSFKARVKFILLELPIVKDRFSKVYVMLHNTENYLVLQIGYVNI